MAGKLVPLEGPLQQTITVPNGKSISLGRAPENHIVISDSTISRIHCYFSNGPDGYSVADNGSSNGTFLNGQAVTKVSMKNGDMVRMGPIKFQFVEEESGAHMAAPTRPLSAGGKVCAQCSAVIPDAHVAAGKCRKIHGKTYCRSCTNKLGLVGLEFEGYIVQRILGKGAIGTVYKALQKSPS